MPFYLANTEDGIWDNMPFYLAFCRKLFGTCRTLHRVGGKFVILRGLIPLYGDLGFHFEW